eukprot:1212641-Rhodomonas_salina.1
MACTGALPPNANKGASFVNDPKVMIFVLPSAKDSNEMGHSHTDFVSKGCEKPHHRIERPDQDAVSHTARRACHRGKVIPADEQEGRHATVQAGTFHFSCRSVPCHHDSPICRISSLSWLKHSCPQFDVNISSNTNVLAV